MGGGGQPVDSTRSDDRGAYALTIRGPTRSAIYVVSTWHSGIAPIFGADRGPRDRDPTSLPLYVYDTSSTGRPCA